MMDYKSPIEIAIGQFRLEQEKRIEGEVFKAIQDYGINIDKDELIRALRYDREQYDKGYEDGYDEGYYAGITSIFDAAPKMTNFYKIKAMSVQELAEFICDQSDCDKCPGDRLCLLDGGHANGLVKYLESEVKENDN